MVFRSFRFLLVALCALIHLSAFGQSLTFLGNTSQYLTGVGQIPLAGGFLQPDQTISVTSQTFPISAGQSVQVIYSTDHFATSHSVAMLFDRNVGNNTQWYAVLGPLPAGSDVLYYLRADAGATTLYDNNHGQNFGFVSRHAPATRRGAILQWFATDYATMLKRMPEVVQAGYGAIYLPPPQKSGGGAYSVGYNPFDRFDLGDRLQAGSLSTKYGTTEQLQQVIRLAKRLGLEVYCDLVTNHNDNRGSTNIDRYPNLIPEDFHIHSSADTTNNQIDFNNAPNLGFNVLNYDLVGLADIAHEDGNLAATGPFTLPNFASFNAANKPSFVRQPLQPLVYPGQSPVTEDVREYLKRWGWWLTKDIGFDGFRIDAVRHTDPSFFSTLNNQGGYAVSNGNLLPYLYSLNSNLLIFGEDNSTDNYEQREYLKTGMNLLDFPLKYAMDSLFNSSGYGSLGTTLANNYGIDSNTSATFEHGGLSSDLGVTFVQSHDQGPPQASNLAHAFTLTRPGNTIVYYDGNNQVPGDYSQFPKPGRADSIGGVDDDITRLVDARARFGRGSIVNRYVSDNAYVYERDLNNSAVLLVGLNIRGDFTNITATVQTTFASGTVLEDLSGQMPQVTVASDQTTTITIPSNSVPGNINNAHGYVIYAPVTPKPVGGLTLTDSVSGLIISPGTVTTPAGLHGQPGSYRAWTLTSGILSVSASMDSLANTGYVRIDAGISIPGHSPLSGTSEGLADGFYPLNSSGNGQFSLNNLDLSKLDDGLHVLRFRFFVNTGSLPGLFADQVAFLYIRQGQLSQVDGDFTKYGAPLVTQTLAPSSQSNRLDEIFATNDDQYLYLGFAGTVDPGPSFTNGLVAFLDTDPGAGTGVQDFGSLADDNGPAGRLFSNARVTAPAGFGAEFAIASFRQGTIDSAFGWPFSGGIATPPTFGAQSGVFGFSANQLAFTTGIPSKIVWKPRSDPFGTPTGMEVAIPLRSLYSAVNTTTELGIIGYVCTTGEQGTTLPAHDPSRATLGGRPASISYVTNQFLPPQNGIASDPGTTPVILSNYARYPLKFASNRSRLYAKLYNTVTNGNTVTQTVALINISPDAATGPFYIMIRPLPGVTVTNATARSIFDNSNYYLKLPVSSLAGRGIVYADVTYTYTGSPRTFAKYGVKVGAGIP